MDDTTRAALDTDRVIDITTVGRSSGEARRIEIWYHRVDGRYYITGTPGRRSWYANLLVNPDFTFHLKQSAQVDLAAVARPVTAAAEHATVVAGILRGLAEAGVTDVSLDETSPLVEVAFPQD